MVLNKKIKIIAIAVFIIGIALMLFFYKWLWKDNIKAETGEIELLIPTGSTYDDLVRIIKEKDILKSLSSFDLVAKVLKYKEGKVLSGRYMIKNDMSSFALVRMLRAGFQTPVKITFNNVRTIEQLAGKLAGNIEPDSLTLLNYFLDSANLSGWGFNKYNLISMFIPDSYEFYWNTSPEKLVSRFRDEHDKFWSKNDRKARASKLGLKPDEVYTVASIVEKETLVNDEKSTISSVYLNRLNSGQRLQADPTVVFATGDFATNRVYEKHTQTNSPYNTYRHAGLPPGPICMPDVSTIDAVLDTKDTDYMFFCAVGDGSGRHAFAKTFEQHLQNANKYRELLNKQDIR